MSDEDVDTFRDKIPLLQQRLASWEVEPPTIEPGLPRGEGGHFREGSQECGTVRERVQVMRTNLAPGS